MKKLSLILAVTFMAAALFAQAPVNDHCDNPVALGLAPNCTANLYTNINATPSVIGVDNVPSCFAGNEPGDDVWFTFVCPAAPLDFRVLLTGQGADPISGPQLAVYRGDCSLNGLAELACLTAPVGQTEVYLDLTALTPGATYFIRVSDNSPVGNANAGTFNLCVTEIPPPLTIDQGSSTLCQATIYDTGGPNGNYGANENHAFTICPSTPTTCIEFTLEYFNFDAGPGVNPAFPGQDVLSFYDGATVNAPLLAQINGLNPPTGTDGGGGVCFRVQAASGCLTLAFKSDSIGQFEGFKGNWTCSAKSCEPAAPIALETALNNTDIVNAIQAPGTTITISDIKCPYGAYGTFSLATDNNDLGLKQGLVLTSGNAMLIAGPNNDDDATLDNFAPGDDDLDYLSKLQGANIESLDACVVELDVFVATDELSFEYVFGSEEYPEYANDVYNDIFAFLASGPGIVGDPNLGGAKNIAVLPGTTTPVQINSVNNLLNWEYYRNNGVWANSTLQYDGFTSDYLGRKKSLTARVEVIPCNTYHLKLAVADRFDRLYDSGVFISEVRGGAPELAVDFASGLEYFVENCSGDQDRLVIRLSKAKATATSFNIGIGGTAVLGTDYLLNIPAVLTFPPGDTALSFPIIPLSDLEAEGTETITVSLSKDFGCGAVFFQTITIELHDNPQVRINQGADTLFVCPGGSAQLQANGALSYSWAPAQAVSNPNVANPTILPTQDIWLRVTGTVGSCSETDSIFVKIITTPSLDVLPISPAKICQGDTLQLFASSNAGSANLSWTPKSRLSDPSSSNPLAFPLLTTNYTATLNVPGCAAINKQLTVLVDTLFFPNIPSDSVSICLNTTVQLAELLNGSTKYLWTPADDLNHSDVSGPIASPSQSTLYTLVATSANSACSQTATVFVTIPQGSVDILGAAEILHCMGDTLVLIAATDPAGASLSWEPINLFNPNTGPTVSVVPTDSVTITASAIISGCPVFDSVIVRLLPGILLSALELDPVQDTLCEGAPLRLKVTATPPDQTFVWLENGQALPDANSDTLLVYPPGADAPLNTLYSVVATDANGCTAVAGPVAQWVNRCFIFPNAFTPDGDSYNDVFGGILSFGKDPDVQEFRIFNRWGQQVFEATADQKSWDGRVNGKEAPSDVYVYYLRLRFANGEARSFKGNVTLLR